MSSPDGESEITRSSPVSVGGSGARQASASTTASASTDCGRQRRARRPAAMGDRHEPCSSTSLARVANRGSAADACAAALPAWSFAGWADELAVDARRAVAMRSSALSPIPFTSDKSSTRLTRRAPCGTRGSLRLGRPDAGQERELLRGRRVDVHDADDGAAAGVARRLVRGGQRRVDRQCRRERPRSPARTIVARIFIPCLSFSGVRKSRRDGESASRSPAGRPGSRQCEHRLFGLAVDERLDLRARERAELLRARQRAPRRGDEPRTRRRAARSRVPGRGRLALQREVLAHQYEIASRSPVLQRFSVAISGRSSLPSDAS